MPERSPKPRRTAAQPATCCGYHAAARHIGTILDKAAAAAVGAGTLALAKPDAYAHGFVLVAAGVVAGFVAHLLTAK